MKRLVQLGVFTAAFLAAGSGIARADSINASLYTAYTPSGNTLIPIAIQGITPPSQSNITGSGYTVSFSTPSNQGVVNGNVSNLHAVPVAGVAAGNPEYLTGDYNSKLTTQLSMAGNYFSTGGTSANDGTHDTITISFTTAQTSFTLLWGSIDTGNQLTFYETNGTQFVVTGAQVQAAAAGFISNGYQGPGGSAYVIVDTTVGFSKVVATSSNVSFEFAGVAANTTNFVPGTAPEPSSFGLIGLAAGLARLFVWRRTRTRAYPPNAKAQP